MDYVDFSKRVAKKKNKFDIKAFSHVRAFPLLAARPRGLALKWWRQQMPNFVKLYDTFGDIDGQSIMRYIILTYDIKSPYRSTAPLLKNRKEVVARDVELHVDYKDGCISLSNDTVAAAMADYLRFQDERTWRLIVQNQEVFDNNEKEIILALDSDKDKDRLQAAKYKADLLKFQDDIDKRLVDLHIKFTGNDPAAELALKRVMFNPENVSELLDGDEEE